MVIKIDESGAVQFIQNDAIDMRQFGKPTLKRASHVEWDDDGDGGWYVDLSPVGGPLVKGFGDRRAEALDFERRWIEENVLCLMEKTMEKK